MDEQERLKKENEYLRVYIKGLELMLTAMRLGRPVPEKAVSLMEKAKIELVKLKASL